METLRTSSYLIPVKLESEPGKYMLIHGYTGAIDIVTESLLKKDSGCSFWCRFTGRYLTNIDKTGIYYYQKPRGRN